MRRNIARRWRWLLAGTALLAAALLVASAQSSGAVCTDNGVLLNLHCAALPNTSAVGQWADKIGEPLRTQPPDGQTDPNAYLDFDLWAWNSFIAMNWPAPDPVTKRGFPDLNSSFADAANDATAVWETYKEKREVFLFDYMDMETSDEIPLPWNAPPTYGPSDSQVPCCPGATCNSNLRELGQASKTIFDTLDETAEVASEAIETRDVLCKGWVDPETQCSLPGANTCCTLNGLPVGPRVWMGDPFTDKSAKPVLYEVKVNYDFFDYVVNSQKLYDVKTARAAASAGNIHLPARTGAAAMPPAPGTKTDAGINPGPTSYSTADCLNNMGDTPCLAGSVHLKAAWIDLTDADSATRQKYHIADVLHYLSNKDVQGGICKEPATYGLIGLHIIQRIHHDAGKDGGGNGSGPPRGGTYVFATWEHNDNDTAGFTYANYSAAPPTGAPDKPAPFPNIAKASALPLNRVYPPLASTQRANDLIHGPTYLDCANKSSVWCNYNLIGTQYAATQLPDPEPKQLTSLVPQPANIEAPANSGQPYYLANLVIESNVGLQQFQGLPLTTDAKVITVIDHFKNGNPGHVTSQFSTSGFQRQSTAYNLAFRTRSGGNTRPFEYTMGGCMGCHGVAQLSGYAFSFVLLDNQYGAVPDTLTDFGIPPTPDPPN